MTIRVTICKDPYTGWDGRDRPARTQVKEFADVAAADNWFTHDSYFAESYTRLAVWARVDDDAPTREEIYARVLDCARTIEDVEACEGSPPPGTCTVYDDAHADLRGLLDLWAGARS